MKNGYKNWGQASARLVGDGREKPVVDQKLTDVLKERNLVWHPTRMPALVQPKCSSCGKHRQFLALTAGNEIVVSTVQDKDGSWKGAKDTGVVERVSDQKFWHEVPVSEYAQAREGRLEDHGGQRPLAGKGAYRTSTERKAVANDSVFIDVFSID